MKERFNTIKDGEIPADLDRKRYALTSELNDSMISTYENNLGISIEDLKGKKVLDIGGMMGGEFSEEAKKVGADLTTVDYSNPYGQRGGKNVKGLMQQLPFDENKFDIELCHGVLPYLPNYEGEYDSTFSEMVRTLKASGRAVIFPVIGTVKDSEVFQRIIDGLKNISDVSFEEVELPPEFQFDREGELQHFFRLILVKK